MEFDKGELQSVLYINNQPKNTVINGAIVVVQFFKKDGVSTAANANYSYPMSRIIRKIDHDEFIRQFLYFEGLTLHLLALYQSSTFLQYISAQRLIGNVSMFNRIKELKSRGLQINSLDSLLKIRNQIAHNITPALIKFNGKYYPPNDKDFIKMVQDIIEKNVVILVDAYRKEQEKIRLWRDDINAILPEMLRRFFNDDVKDRMILS
jgi:hypothetical protein